MARLATYISTGIAVFCGTIVLVGYFIPVEWIINLRTLILRWATILMGLAVLIGIINLFSVHWRKIYAMNRQSWYSLALLFAMGVTISIVGWYNPSSIEAIWVFDYILIPVESSLMAVLAIVLIVAAMRLLVQRKSLFSMIFLLTVLLILIGAIPFASKFIPFDHNHLTTWIITVPVMAGARGLLLGMALGILTTGIRVIVGNHRPYDG